MADGQSCQAIFKGQDSGKRESYQRDPFGKEPAHALGPPEFELSYDICHWCT